MKKGVFFAIVIGGGIIGVIAIFFFIFSNPYRTLNPGEFNNALENNQASASGTILPPTPQEDHQAVLQTINSKPLLGLSVGIDGERLVFFDTDEQKIKVSEFDGSGEQDLSEKLVGVNAMGLAPTKDKAWLQIDDPKSKDQITLVYDFRAREAVRLENGIQAIDWSPSGSELVYYVKRSDSMPMLRRVTSNGLAPRSIRENFVLQDPVLNWYATNAIAFWQTPRADRQASIITMTDLGTQAIELVGDLNANQAVFSPDGTRVLVGNNDPVTQKPTLLIGNVATKEFNTISLTTWVDKCTWSKDSTRILCFVPSKLKGGFTYPDDIAEDIGLADYLWSIEAATGEPRRIFDLPDSVGNASNPVLTDDLTRITFTDLNSGNLISLDLTDKISAPASAASKETNKSTAVSGVTLPNVNNNSPL